MAIIVGIKFRSGNKIYYFDPKNIQFNEGDGVIVETARGQEFGVVSITNKEVEEKDIVDEYTLTAQKSIEQNIIYIMFSPNEFIKATDASVKDNLPRMLSYSEFMKWKGKCRSRDAEMRVDIQNISIRRE